MSNRLAIDFPDRPAAWYDIEQHTITFPVVVDNNRKACVVAGSDLMLRFAGSSSFTPLEVRAVYDEYRDEVRKLAEAEIRGPAAIDELEEFTIQLTGR